MATHAPVQIDRQRIKELIEREEKALNEATAQVGGDVQARARRAVRRRRVLLPAARPVADLPRARQGPEGVGRRRQRDVRLPQRVRRDGPGPRAPGDRQGDPRPLRRRARTSPRRPRTPSSSPRSCRAAGACRAGATRTPAPRPRWTPSASRAPTRRRDTVHEDLRLLPRPPRHGDGLDRRRVRQDRRPRQPRLAALRRRHPAGDRRHDRSPCRSTTPARWSAGSSGSPRRAACPPA